jgi:hypothetical protein
MKKTLFTLMLASMLAFTARGQVLQGTLWRAYNWNNVPDLYWYFAQDTLYVSYDNVSFFDSTVFTTVGSLFTIEVMNFFSCVQPYTGTYNFLITGDTLRFTVINDLCFQRLSYFNLHYFLRITTGIEDINPISPANISPNPSADGIFNLSFNDVRAIHESPQRLPKRIYVLSADGRKIMEEMFSSAATNHIINLQSCASGIYFLVMENDLGRKVSKLIR